MLSGILKCVTYVPEHVLPISPVHTPIKGEGTDCFLDYRLLTEKRMLLVKSEIPSTLMGC